ncbi:MAG: DUF368 domain-containing protein, partial [Planctomycetota bacterium]
AGCLTGLLLFSRVLKWLLAHYAAPTMAALCGFMVGSLYKIWPFQVDTTPTVEKFKEKIFEPYLPEAFDAQAAAYLGVAVGCFLLVTVVDAVSRLKQTTEERTAVADA